MKHIYDMIVIGGGPAGLEAARILAERQFKVVLFEKKELGFLSLAARKKKTLPYTKIASAKTYFDWVLPTIYCLKEAPIKLNITDSSEVMLKKSAEEITNMFTKDVLMDWDTDLVYENTMKKQLETQFEYQYPYAQNPKTKQKLSVSELKKRGIKDLVVLSGDNENIVSHVCKSVGISRYSAELMPQDKVTYLTQAKKEKVDVMFVGDGVNDAPAILVADLGVSMGGIGSDAALEASDIVIMNDDLNKINTAIDISTFTKTIIKQNITFMGF